MSVFTPVDPASLAHWLSRHDLGEPGTLTPIAEGVENTNFFLDVGSGRYVLTLFERLEPQALPFYLGLMRRLARAGVPCPEPVPARDGSLFAMLCGKPAALVTRLTGRPVAHPMVRHCASIGDWMARMHLALAAASPRLPNPRGESWRREAADAVRRFLAADERGLLLDALILRVPDDLPRGIVHADLFRDNALWADGDEAAPRLAGVIDFYFAGEDAFLFDLAVAANDWCQTPDGTMRQAIFDAARCEALVAGYSSVRPLTASERSAWPTMLVVAALRFWLSRLVDRHLPRAGALVRVKDPGEYRDILAARLADFAPARR